MKFSDEMINAYADGELQGNEKTEFEMALLNDLELQQSLDEIVALKSQIRSAYMGVSAPEQKQHTSVNYRAVMYGCLLLLAFTGGWVSSDMALQQRESLAQGDTTDESLHVSAEQPGKYILHIGTHDTDKFRHILDKAENLMAKYQDEMQLIELEIIANASGLDLFRESASPYAQRVKQLGEKYPNIRFIACTNAIERLRERGIEPDLINTVHQGPTALDQVVKRMNDGWTYIKI